MMNYVRSIKLKEMPKSSSYLSKLPIVRYLYSIDRLLLDYHKDTLTEGWFFPACRNLL
jgi:predicted ATPase